MKRVPPLSFLSCVLAAVMGLPLLQTILWCMGCWLNEDLLNQFSFDGTNRDSWEDLLFATFFGGLGQMFLGLLLGSLTALSASSAWPWRRVLLLFLGGGGSCLFSVLLWHNWNFERNHCTTSGCSATSSLVFDFTVVVPLLCPLLWCLGVLMLGATIRKEQRLFSE